MNTPRYYQQRAKLMARKAYIKARACGIYLHFTKAGDVLARDLNLADLLAAKAELERLKKEGK
jgi:hypothetical protein